MGRPLGPAPAGPRAAVAQMYPPSYYQQPGMDAGPPYPPQSYERPRYPDYTGFQQRDSLAPPSPSVSGLGKRQREEYAVPEAVYAAPRSYAGPTGPPRLRQEEWPSMIPTALPPDLDPAVQAALDPTAPYGRRYMFVPGGPQYPPTSVTYASMFGDRPTVTVDADATGQMRETVAPSLYHPSTGPAYSPIVTAPHDFGYGAYQHDAWRDVPDHSFPPQSQRPMPPPRYDAPGPAAYPSPRSMGYPGSGVMYGPPLSAYERTGPPPPPRPPMRAASAPRLYYPPPTVKQGPAEPSGSSDQITPSAASAPAKEKRKLRCTLCGEMKKGHTCPVKYKFVEE